MSVPGRDNTDTITEASKSCEKKEDAPSRDATKKITLIHAVEEFEAKQKSCDRTVITVGAQMDDIKDNWAEVHFILNEMCLLSIIFTLLFDIIGLVEVTHELFKTDGRTRRQYFFIYSMSQLAVIVSVPVTESIRFQSMIYSLFGRHVRMLPLFLLVLIFSVVISASALAMFRYFYMHIVDVYDYSESWLWYYIVNRHLVLFAILLSRAVPATLIHGWSTISVLGQIAHRASKYVLLTVLKSTVFAGRRLRRPVLSAQKYFTANWPWFAFFWLVIIVLFTTRETPQMQSLIVTIRDSFSYIAYVLSAVLFYIIYKAMGKLAEESIKKVAIVLYRKYGTGEFLNKYFPRLSSHVLSKTSD